MNNEKGNKEGIVHYNGQICRTAFIVQDLGM